ncbi:MAG: cation:proton antiporter [Burkholderiaceae bacterium]|nr:cation:proton antiporter [Burkholderiaceae bacterium]
MILTLLGFAFAFGLLASRLGLPPMVGFLAAGFAFNQVGLETPPEINFIADLGITLLLFTIGLKLNLKSLAAPRIWAGTMVQMVFTAGFFTLVLLLGQKLYPIEGLALTGFGTGLIAFGLAFSSTVFVVKLLEDRGDVGTLYGQLAIGLLIMQDLVAVVYLAFSEAQYPSLWALSLLALPFVRLFLHKLLNFVGHGELLILTGLALATIVGYSYFHAIGIKGDLGALVLGALLANHPKSSELAQSLYGLKEMMLVGFFLSIGLQGLPNSDITLVALILCLLLPLKTAIYFGVFALSRLPLRINALASLSLSNFSEFGLILCALAARQGFIPIDWLIVFALALSLSFVLSAVTNAKSEALYQRFKFLAKRFDFENKALRDQRKTLLEADILVVGMGRVGAGAYDALTTTFSHQVIGLDHNPSRVDEHEEFGRRVLVADASDTDLWANLRKSKRLQMIILAMPNHHNNIAAAEQVRALHFESLLVAVAKFPEEVEELAALGVTSFNMYSEAGLGLARHALTELQLREP